MLSQLPLTMSLLGSDSLWQKLSFATPAEAELHMYDIAGTWYAYADAHGIDIDINAEGVGGA